MTCSFWNALLHLNYSCAAVASQMGRGGQTLEFSRPQHGEQEILVNEDRSREIRSGLQAGLELLAEVPLATDSAGSWRDDDCRRLIEQTMPVVERFCSELQSRHDSLRDEHGTHPRPIESCDCDMSRLHRVMVNGIELARGRLLVSGDVVASALHLA